MTDTPLGKGEMGTRAGRWVKRHGINARLWHWVNAGVFLVMLMSGLMIFNAHPRLYWGQYGANPDPAWLEIGAMGERGVVRVGDVIVTTTGVLGRFEVEGETVIKAFPSWATLPSDYDLAGARRWHLTFAWAFVVPMAMYALISLVTGHTRRDLLPRWRECRPSHLWDSCKQHFRLDFNNAEHPESYNILQKLVYGLVLFVLFPVIVLTGMAMSPSLDASMPWLLDIFFGRQSARSIHFIATMLLVVFVLVHLVLVIVAGWNHFQSMFTGRFRTGSKE